MMLGKELAGESRADTAGLADTADAPDRAVSPHTDTLNPQQMAPSLVQVVLVKTPAPLPSPPNCSFNCSAR
jgi:hypothetical protein